MSALLQNALRTYQSGNYKKTLTLLAPLLQKSPGADVLLMAAQCHLKSDDFAKAANYYGKAAQLSGPKRPMLETLAAKMLQKAGLSEQALDAARRAARGGDFDREAEETYRRFLHAFLRFDETEKADHDFLDMLLSGDLRYFAVENPLDHISWCTQERLHARLSRIQAGAAFTEQSRQARRLRPHVFGEKIRIGYLSNDFSDQHATMRLFQGVLFAHDREKFDIFLFCHTDADVISADKGLRRQYRTIVPIGHLDDAAAQALILSHGIDILVDLKGHTKGTRIDLINRGLAPIQAAYLGFPGSGNGIDCDYVISDPVVTPDSSKPFYREKLCRLPESYQSNDDTHRPLIPAAARVDLGLPQDKFIFASFNAIRKITPATARLWAEILTGVDNSILWTMCNDGFAQENLLAFMDAAGIARSRILFAKSESYGPHIARLQAADLGLDTFPYNGHTTTSDKLWAGLPVVTSRGTSFASRVSESLLRALDVPELVADDADDYVRLCIALAQDPERLAAIRAKIAGNRFRAPLFDTVRFTRHLEGAYERMVERHRQGLAPDHIDVPPLPRSAEPFGPR